MQTKVLATVFLLAAIGLLFIANVIEISMAVINFDNLTVNYVQVSLIRNPAIFNLLGIFTAGMFLLFIDYFENENISATRLAIYSSICVGHLVNLSIVIGLDPETIKLDPSLGFLTTVVGITILLGLPIFSIYVSISCLRSIAAVKKYAFDLTQIRQLNQLSLTIILYYVVTLVFLISGSLLNQNEMLSDDLFIILFVILPRSSQIAGSLLLWYAYAMSTRTAFLQPQRMHRLLIIARTGVPLYSFNFRKEIEGTDSILLSGGITAIKSLLKEAVGTSSEIVAIRFKEKEIMVRSYSNFGIFLIVDRTSNFLRRAMDSFGNEFAQQFQINELELIDETKFKDADSLIKKNFGLA